MDYTMKNNFL